MKIGEYEQMMAYLTRPGFNGGSGKKPTTIEELKKSGKITTADKVDRPDKAKLLQAIRDFELRNPRKDKSEGGPMVPEPKPLTEEIFKENADRFIKGALGGFPKDEMITKLQEQLDKVQESGTFSKEQAINFINERTKQLREFIKQNPCETLPGLETRENFYAGSSLEQYGSKIKNLFLKGTSIPNINEILGFEKDRTTTIDEFIKSMKSGKAPVKITADELSKRPKIIGTNVTGKPGKRKTELSKWVKNFEKTKGRLPSMQEAREEFDYTLIKKTRKTGEIKYLPQTEAKSMGALKSGQEDILKLSKDPKIRNMFKTGDVGKTNVDSILNHVREVLKKPNISDDVAGGKIHALAEVFSGQTKLEGIKPTFIKNAKSISTSFPFKARIRDIRERKVGESVGEQSIKSDKTFTRRQDIYKDLGISKVASIDEPAGITSSVKKGSTPYAIFAQIINKDLNSGDKMRFDSLKSNYEGKVKNAIENAKANGIDPRKDKTVNKAVKDFNKIVNFYEKRFNAKTRAGDKKLNLLRISLDDPSKTVSRYGELPDSYKTAFDDVYKNNGYSFKVAKDIKTIPEIKNDVISNPEKFAKNLGRSNAPRLYADVLPGFGDLIESIGEDFKQGKYGKASFKSLGALSIPVAGYFAQEEFRKGDPVLDIVSSAATGFKPTEALARRFVSEEKGGYTDAERLARAQLKLLENPPKTSMDMSAVLSLAQQDPEFTGNPGQYLSYLQSKRDDLSPNQRGIESLATDAEKRFQEQIMKPFRERKAKDRGTLTEGIKSLFNPYQFGPIDPNMKLAFQTGGRVGFADGNETPVVTVEDKIDEMIAFYQDYLRQGGKMKFKTFAKKYIPQNFATGGRAGFSVGGLASLFKKAAQVSDALRKVKNATFEMFNNVRMFGDQKGIEKNLQGFTNIPDKNRKISSLEDIQILKASVPEKYHQDLDIMAKSIEQNNFETAFKQYEKFENNPEEYFPMIDPLNDSFVITGPRESFKSPRYSFRTNMELDPKTKKPTGKYQTEKLEIFDPETGTFREEGKVVGVTTEKGKEGLN